MTQISRPFQIALVAVRRAVRSCGSSRCAGTPPAAKARRSRPPPAQPAAIAAARASASAPARAPGSPGSPGSVAAGSSTYHGSAPGVAGLTRAIAKARGAVAQSQQNAQRLQQKSDAGLQPPHSGAVASPARTRRQAGSPGDASGHAVARRQTQPRAGRQGATPTAPAPSPRTPRPASPAMQAKVEAPAQARQGRGDPLLEPQGLRRRGRASANCRRAGRAFAGKLAVHVATLRPGRLVRHVHARRAGLQHADHPARSTPRASTSSVTGLTDAFSIEQAVSEAKQRTRALTAPALRLGRVDATADELPPAPRTTAQARPRARRRVHRRGRRRGVRRPDPHLAGARRRQRRRAHRRRRLRRQRLRRGASPPAAPPWRCCATRRCSTPRASACARSQPSSAA